MWFESSQDSSHRPEVNIKRVMTQPKQKCQFQATSTLELLKGPVVAPSVTRPLILEVLNLVPGVGQHVGLYVSQNCTE